MTVLQYPPLAALKVSSTDLKSWCMVHTNYLCNIISNMKEKIKLEMKQEVKYNLNYAFSFQYIFGW